MPRRALIIIAGLAIAGLLVVGAAAAYVLRTPAASSGEFTAIPVLPTAAQATEAEVAPATDAPAGVIVLEIVQAESEARFIINEILNGNPKTVVGVTDQVAAQIIVDVNNPANTQMGVVQVNARTLVTDSGNRNRAIQNQILDTGEFEFITFTPTSFIHFPTGGAVGDTFTFHMVGDLTIRAITQEVAFEVTVTAESGTRLRGLASTTIQREAFDLTIPSVPQVAGVDESVLLELEFVAQAQ
ncbi:MAG: YceI family protein [Anaerolineales bacterium]